MEYTLDELAGVGRGLGEGCNAFGKAVDNKGDVWAESFIHGEGVEQLGKIEKARIRAHVFRLAHRGGECKTDGLTAGFGKVVQVIVCDLRVQGVISDSDIGRLAYVLKYLRKAVAQA